MTKENIEYCPYIETKTYYIIFYDSNNQQHMVDVSKEIFLCFFGTHEIKKINGEKHYFIKFIDGSSECSIRLSYDKYKKFMSFKSQIIKENNIYSRYIEQSQLTENTLHKRLIIDSMNINETLYKDMLYEELYKAINQLENLQKRRLQMYYFEYMTYEEIAKIEGCTKRAVKSSIDIAKRNLYEKLKKYKF